MARTGATSVRALAVFLGCLIPLSAAPLTARADTEETREEARRLFGQGSTAFLAKRYGEALDELRASYKLVPSPNSGLLIARCLRELNRRIEAVDMYATVATDARKRATDGDVRYSQTADVAALEGAAVRATLGMLRVRVAHPSPGSQIEIDGAASPATDDEIVVLHSPGEVTVKFKPRTGAEQSQRATLAAGGDVRMEFTPGDRTEPVVAAPTEPPRVVAPPDRGRPPSWTVPATLVASGLALVGTGVFVGFRLKSDAIYDELKQSCEAQGGCTAADQPKADIGRRDQTIADVGLVVGIAGAAAAVTFLFVRAYGPRTTAATPPTRLIVTAGALGARF